jgi:hypothetical protein
VEEFFADCRLAAQSPNKTVVELSGFEPMAIAAAARSRVGSPLWGIRARSRPPSAENLPFDAAVASVRADAAAIRSEAALIFGRAN